MAFSFFDICVSRALKTPDSFVYFHELTHRRSIHFHRPEFTGYLPKGQFGDRVQLLDVVSDVILILPCRRKRWKKERGVLLEINMYEDIPQRQVVTNLWPCFIPTSQPVSPSLAAKNIRAMKRENFDYRQAHYLAQATTVVVAGNIDEEKVRRK